MRRPGLSPLCAPRHVLVLHVWSSCWFVVQEAWGEPASQTSYMLSCPWLFALEEEGGGQG